MVRRELDALNLELKRCSRLWHSPAGMKFVRDLDRLSGPYWQLGRVAGLLRSKRWMASAEVGRDQIIGSVRSWTRDHLCRLSRDGTFSCCDRRPQLCARTRPSPCKHLCALMVWLVMQGTVSPRRALRWMSRALGHKPDLDKAPFALWLLAGQVAPVVDWRPDVALAEDHYAL